MLLTWLVIEMKKTKMRYFVLLYVCVFVAGFLTAVLDWEEIIFHSFAFVFGLGMGIVLGLGFAWLLFMAMMRLR